MLMLSPHLYGRAALTVVGLSMLGFVFAGSCLIYGTAMLFPVRRRP